MLYLWIRGNWSYLLQYFRLCNLSWGISARVSHHGDLGSGLAPCNHLSKVTLVTCEKSVVQFFSTKHRRFSPDTPISPCSNTEPMRGGPYWTSRENSLLADRVSQYKYRHYFALLYFTLLYFTLLYFNFTLLYFTLLYLTILHHTLPYFTILYYTILY